jgi:hypothetical protein
LRWVTCRTLSSVFDWLRNINFCRFLTLGQSPSRVAVKIRCRNRRTPVTSKARHRRGLASSTSPELRIRHQPEPPMSHLVGMSAPWQRSISGMSECPPSGYV